MATEITFQQGVQPDGGYAGCQDNFLRSTIPTWNYGINTYITCTDPGYVGLISFDISDIPAGQVIIACSMFLRVSTGGAGRNISAHAGKVSWVGGTKNGATAGAGESCWAAREADGSGGVTTAWGAAGGLSGTDYEAVATDTQEALANILMEWDVLAPATAWYENSANNFGIWLFNSSGQTVNLHSAHATYAPFRPYLVVTYEPAAAEGAARSKIGRSLAHGSALIGGGLVN